MYDGFQFWNEQLYSEKKIVLSVISSLVGKNYM